MKSLLKAHAVTAAVLCLVLWAGSEFLYPLPVKWVFLGLGVAFLLLALTLNARETRSAMGTRTARYGTGATPPRVMRPSFQLPPSSVNTAATDTSAKS